ncbi:MAG TPA: hypothetical protein VFL91_33200 [Thermomicrobiales bacterium]|nr:hypothetical protein [Thermomicrobiales bacterium]
MGDRELITLKEARERLGISRVTMTKLVKEGRFTLYENPLDRREKLVDAADVAAYARPKPMAPAHKQEGR